MRCAATVRRLASSAALLALAAIVAAAGGCAPRPAPAWSEAGAGMTLNADLPREFRQVVERQDRLSRALADDLRADGERREALLSDYARAMRQANDQLTCILAGEIMQLQDESPPIRRINAWTAVKAIVDYADLERLRALEGPGPLSERLDAWYARAVAAAEPQRLRRLLHVELDTLAALLAEPLRRERSENVRFVAAPVVDMLAAEAGKSP